MSEENKVAPEQDLNDKPKLVNQATNWPVNLLASTKPKQAEPKPDENPTLEPKVIAERTLKLEQNGLTLLDEELALAAYIENPTLKASRISYLQKIKAYRQREGLL